MNSKERSEAMNDTKVNNIERGGAMSDFKEALKEKEEQYVEIKKKCEIEKKGFPEGSLRVSHSCEGTKYFFWCKCQPKIRSTAH